MKTDRWMTGDGGDKVSKSRTDDSQIDRTIVASNQHEKGRR